MIGYTSAIFAAFLWAFASFLFRDSGKSEHPLKLNFLKGIIALALLTFSAIILSSDFTIDKESLFLLGISGVIGIGIADPAYFYSLKNIMVDKKRS